MKGLCKRELVNFQQWRSFGAHDLALRNRYHQEKDRVKTDQSFFSVTNDTNNKLNLIFFDNKQQDELIELIESSPLRERN